MASKLIWNHQFHQLVCCNDNEDDYATLQKQQVNSHCVQIQKDGSSVPCRILGIFYWVCWDGYLNRLINLTTVNGNLISSIRNFTVFPYLSLFMHLQSEETSSHNITSFQQLLFKYSEMDLLFPATTPTSHHMRTIGLRDHRLAAMCVCVNVWWVYISP